MDKSSGKERLIQQQRINRTILSMVRGAILDKKNKLDKHNRPFCDHHLYDTVTAPFFAAYMNALSITRRTLFCEVITAAPLAFVLL